MDTTCTDKQRMTVDKAFFGGLGAVLFIYFFVSPALQVALLFLGYKSPAKRLSKRNWPQFDNQLKRKNSMLFKAWASLLIYFVTALRATLRRNELSKPFAFRILSFKTKARSHSQASLPRRFQTNENETASPQAKVFALICPKPAETRLARLHKVELWVLFI